MGTTGEMRTIDSLTEVLRNPHEVALDWKAQGKKVVGYRCIYVPEEIIWAAGMLPYPLYGTPDAVGVADSYFQSCVCEFVRNIFDHAIAGRLSFLDAVVLPNTCDAVRRLYDMWNGYIGTSSCYAISNPQKLCTEVNRQFYRTELERFKTYAEDLSGKKITNEALKEAIDLHNENRRLLKAIYSLRKLDPPPLSGSEALDIAMAATLLPKDKSNDFLRQLLEELKAKQATEALGPRIMVTGSIMDNSALIRLVEEAGATVVVDDLCNTLRNFWYQVEAVDDPMEALYRFSNNRPLCACMYPPDVRLEYLMELIREFSIDAVIYFNLKYCHPFIYEAPHFRPKLQAEGIPTVLFEVGHDLSGIGQLRTRIQAFVEMLELE